MRIEENANLLYETMNNGQEGEESILEEFIKGNRKTLKEIRAEIEKGKEITPEYAQEQYNKLSDPDKKTIKKLFSGKIKNIKKELLALFAVLLIGMGCAGTGANKYEGFSPVAQMNLKKIDEKGYSDIQFKNGEKLEAALDDYERGTANYDISNKIMSLTPRVLINRLNNGSDEDIRKLFNTDIKRSTLINILKPYENRQESLSTICSDTRYRKQLEKYQAK